MSRPEAFGRGEAVVSRVDQGYDKPLTWVECVEVSQHPTKNLNRAELVEVIAYLAAQLSGSRASLDAEASLAIGQIKRILRDLDASQKAQGNL